MTKISINIVTWNGLKYLERCLESVLSQTYKDFQIIFLDNGSTDGTGDWISAFLKAHPYSKIRFIQNKKNLGFAKGHNQTIKESNTEYVFQLNQDTELDKYFLENVVRFLDKHTQTAGVTGKIYRLTDEKKSDMIDSSGHILHKNFSVTERGEGEIDFGQYNTNQEVVSISGTAPVFRKYALEQVQWKGQYFDEDFFAYKEDIDLSLRLRALGWKLYCVPSAILYHYRTASFEGRKKTYIAIVKNRRKKSKLVNYYSYRNHLFVILKNFPLEVIQKFFPCFIFYELKKLAYLSLFEPISLIKAIFSFLSLVPEMLKKRKYIQNRKTISNEQFITQWIKEK